MHTFDQIRSIYRNSYSVLLTYIWITIFSLLNIVIFPIFFGLTWFWEMRPMKKIQWGLPTSLRPLTATNERVSNQSHCCELTNPSHFCCGHRQHIHCSQPEWLDDDCGHREKSPCYSVGCVRGSNHQTESPGLSNSVSWPTLPWNVHPSVMQTHPAFVTAVM